jgi:GH15 family glucan-1,4-alpha-glucosidase
MTLPIENYALLGDCKSAGLVGFDGSIDWLCWPRFDSPACFAALLGDSENGRWLIRPRQTAINIRRSYRPGTLVLDTEFETSDGNAILTDFMVPGDGAHLVRIVTGVRGCIEFSTELLMRFNYGGTVPWVARLDDGGAERDRRSRVLGA